MLSRSLSVDPFDADNGPTVEEIAHLQVGDVTNVLADVFTSTIKMFLLKARSTILCDAARDTETALATALAVRPILLPKEAGK